MDRTRTLFPDTPEICRLGLATRGNTHLGVEGMLEAYDRGVRFWNWCGYSDGMSEAVRSLGKDRENLVLSTQIQSRDRSKLLHEIDDYLRDLRTDYLDIATIYFLETLEEWKSLERRKILEELQGMKADGIVRHIGITSHQRDLATTLASSGETELLMVRYNAAHRGAEEEVFPTTDRMQIPVIAYTCLRWGAFFEPGIPDRFAEVPRKATDLYRFVLSNPSVSVALMAPDNTRELQENLTLLEDWRETSTKERAALEEFGDWVHQNANAFP